MNHSLQNKSPLISIIIPFYNHNDYIKETLDSIIADSYPNKEIIIINDGSSDPDDSAITLWQVQHPKSNLTYIKRENHGFTATLNELIKRAQGTFILPCASDDYLINNTLQERINILLNNPEKPILFGDCTVVDSQGKLLYQSSLFELYNGRKENYVTPKGLLTEVVTRWSLAGPQDIMYKSVFDELGFYNEKLAVEDWDFYLRATKAYKVAFYDTQPVAAYRRHKHNATQVQNLFYDISRTALHHFFRIPFPLNMVLIPLALKNLYWGIRFSLRKFYHLRFNK